MRFQFIKQILVVTVESKTNKYECTIFLDSPDQVDHGQCFQCKHFIAL